MNKRVATLLIVVMLMTACTTTKTERELHKCFAQCAKAHEEDSLPRAQCNDLCAEKAKPTVAPTTPASHVTRVWSPSAIRASTPEPSCGWPCRSRRWRALRAE